ncbi:unnamed protein product [Didymodactylos carnosus]|uniref:Uncharacterized protein n=1 Tax=Didymodactylos carnosus TaxID=1234261 RepID=A0A8S2PEZ5_9BILA|nr:unnamed protein product [Didymodactylos carnosus]CAF4048443.1 unnamed protein product [Didymodactylos carnosus]
MMKTLFVQLVKDRFTCSDTEQTCFLPTMLGGIGGDCLTKNREEYDMKSNVKLSDVQCLNLLSKNCQYLWQYPEQSWSLIDSTSLATNNERSNVCKYWIYPPNYYQLPIRTICAGKMGL